MRIPMIAACLLLTVACAGGGGEDAADLILVNGKVVTLDGEQVVTAIASRDGRIVAVGSDDEVRRHAGPGTETIDLAGRLAIPGFIEGHGHFTGMGMALMWLDLRSAETWDEIVALAAEAAAEAEPGEWIVGRGWHQDKWTSPPSPAVEGNPVHTSLSAATPDNPVMLIHASGHARIANAKALELAGIDRNTPDPDGGTILRDRQGNPTGVLRETAGGPVGAAYAAAIEGREDEMTRRQIELADEACMAAGVTSFQDAGSGLRTIDLIREAAEAGELDTRLYIMMRLTSDVLAEHAADYRTIGHADDHFTVRAIKRSIDGALGSHGAWLLEPYTDLPETSGLNTVALDEMAATAKIAIENDLQLAVHAIGDRANRETLDIYEKTFAEHPDKQGLRWRIEHAQHLNPAEIPRFVEMGVVASMQPVHCTSDGPWVPDRIGDERAENGAYVWRTLMDAGVIVSSGTDVPVEPIDPIANYHAAVTRLMGNGERFYPEQVMTRMEALRSFTIEAAKAAFEEELKGTLAPGKLADIVVLSQDILTVPEEQIRDTTVDVTIVGGKVRYRRE